MIILTQVIYADVLFILNVYITYALLMLTAFISGAAASRWRIAAASAVGGLYSFVILIPHISDTVLALSRIPAAVVFILISFGKVRIRPFVRNFSCFFLVNFIFAGFMLALWYFVNPQNIYLDGFVVYFHIEPLTLIIFTAICYFAIKGINRLIKIKAPENSIYRMKLHINNIDFEFPAFYDTGNSLSDPFTGRPVIIVSRSALNELFPSDEDICTVAAGKNLKIRYLPCTCVGGKAILPCIKAQRVEIKGISVSIEINDALIAITDETIKNGDFSALLPSGIFHNTTNEKGEDFDEKTNRAPQPIEK